MQERTVRWIVLAGTVLTLTAGIGLADEPILLDQRYTDALHGFSLCPPAGVERRREFATSTLVSWVRRDAQTGAILWTLTVAQAIEGNQSIDLEPYAQALASRLRAEENYNIESVELQPVAGKQAIHYTGQMTTIRLWRKQVWILTEPQRFLIVMITGPVTIQPQLEAVCGEVLDTLQWFDPAEAQRRHREALKRGQDFLAALNEEKLRAAIDDKPEWFLLQMDGHDVGFRCVKALLAQQENQTGYLIKMWVLLDLPKAGYRSLRHEMFVTPTRQFEHWKKRLAIGRESQANVITESGLKQHEMIVCDVSMADRTQTHKKAVPMELYLPQAIGMLLPRLVDLKIPASYAFATYNTERNDFDKRTFTVLGAETITLVGRSVEAIAAMDTPTANAAPAKLWLAKDGRLLRMQTEDGLVMEASTSSAITRRFAEAQRLAEALTHP